MTRGEIWTVAGGAGYTGKPRPAAIIQDDRFDANDSLTVCPFTTDPTDSPIIRLLVQPSTANGLREPSRLMVDKISTVPRSKFGARLGALDAEDIVGLNRAILVFLGLAGPAP